MPESGQIRRYRRFAGWDYEKGASLFITIATEPRRALFGRIVNGATVLSPLGGKVNEAVEAIPLFNPGIRLFGHVVMPDHVHFNCALAPGLREPLKALGNTIRRFKNHTTKLARLGLAEHSSAINAGGEREDSASNAGAGVDGMGAPGIGRLWQQGYHDYLLLSREMIDSTERYIAYNPMKWEVMYGAGHALRVMEPLASPRLGIGDYWKGVGNLALLGEDVKMVSLRVSREVASPAAIDKVVKRLEAAVEKGYVVISGFISRGEQAVRDMLCARGDARFVRVLPSCIPNKRFKPESIYVKPFSEGRYLEIGRGNDEVAFGRSACLDINAEIIEIAMAGEGLAIYWKGEGPHVLAEHSSAINAGDGRPRAAGDGFYDGDDMERFDGQTAFGETRRGL